MEFKKSHLIILRAFFVVCSRKDILFKDNHLCLVVDEKIEKVTRAEIEEYEINELVDQSFHSALYLTRPIFYNIHLDSKIKIGEKIVLTVKYQNGTSFEIHGIFDVKTKNFRILQIEGNSDVKLEWSYHINLYTDQSNPMLVVSNNKEKKMKLDKSIEYYNVQVDLIPFYTIVDVVLHNYFNLSKIENDQSVKNNLPINLDVFKQKLISFFINMEIYTMTIRLMYNSSVFDYFNFYKNSSVILEEGNGDFYDLLYFPIETNMIPDINSFSLYTTNLINYIETLNVEYKDAVLPYLKEIDGKLKQIYLTLKKAMVDIKNLHQNIQPAGETKDTKRNVFAESRLDNTSNIYFKIFKKYYSMLKNYAEIVHLRYLEEINIKISNFFRRMKDSSDFVLLVLRKHVSEELNKLENMMRLDMYLSFFVSNPSPTHITEIIDFFFRDRTITISSIVEDLEHIKTRYDDVCSNATLKETQDILECEQKKTITCLNEWKEMKKKNPDLIHQPLNILLDSLFHREANYNK